MKRLRLLKNRVQEYDWGSFTAISDLLGEPSPSRKPQAELWMGAHPKAPSLAEENGGWVSLITLIEEDPEGILGISAAEKFNRKLPYLFKVLAASKPLSIQAHPTLHQARLGFDRENQAGIPIDAPERSYRDNMHKPEIICALTPFWALNGFRRMDAIVSNLGRFCPHGLKSQIQGLMHQPDPKGLRGFFESIMTIGSDRKAAIIAEAVVSAQNDSGRDDIADWIITLHREYPSDIGVLSPLYLNLIRLSPGEAMYLPAGQLHAYLNGVGMELMANSDNVLRGGLTPKHMDVAELVNILRFAGGPIEILLPKPLNASEKVYPSRADEFVLSVISVQKGRTYTAAGRRGVEIALCIHGDADIIDSESGHSLSLKKGNAVLIPGAVKQYAVQGRATLYKAAVNC